MALQDLHFIKFCVDLYFTRNANLFGNAIVNTL